MMTREFTGGVFSAAIDGGRAGAEIELSQTGVSALTPDGGRFAIPFGECQIEIGGNSGRMVFCRNHDRSLTIFCEQADFPKALATASMGMLDVQISEQLTNRRRLKRKAQRFGLFAFMGLLLLLVGGFYAIREGARIAVQAVPVSVDCEIGPRAFEAMELEGPEVDDPVVLKAMNKIVDRLKSHAAIEGLNFEVHVVKSPQINAFALPGGTIVVYTGLIEKASDVNQVAGVIAHEMAHATLRHGIERISHSLGIAVALNFLLGDVNGLIVAGAEVLTINSYSREQEAAADAEGVRMLHAAGLDPLGMAKFFAILQEEHGDLPDAISWISTHPEHQDRIDTVKAQVARLPKKEYQPLEIDWENVQQQVK